MDQSLKNIAVKQDFALVFSTGLFDRAPVASIACTRSARLRIQRGMDALFRTYFKFLTLTTLGLK